MHRHSSLRSDGLPRRGNSASPTHRRRLGALATDVKNTAGTRQQQGQQTELTAGNQATWMKHNAAAITARVQRLTTVAPDPLTPEGEHEITEERRQTLDSITRHESLRQALLEEIEHSPRRLSPLPVEECSPDANVPRPASAIPHYQAGPAGTRRLRSLGGTPGVLSTQSLPSASPVSRPYRSLADIDDEMSETCSQHSGSAESAESDHRNSGLSLSLSSAGALPPHETNTPLDDTQKLLSDAKAILASLQVDKSDRKLARVRGEVMTLLSRAMATVQRAAVMQGSSNDTVGKLNHKLDHLARRHEADLEDARRERDVYRNEVLQLKEQLQKERTIARFRSKVSLAKKLNEHVMERIARRVTTDEDSDVPAAVQQPEAILQSPRSLEAAPQGDVTLVFTDVQNSTMLWDAETAGMKAALAAHNNLLRRLLAENGGYEVKTEGDSFMVAFHTPKDALMWCSLSQTELLKVDWPAPIMRFAADCGEERDEFGTLLFRGLRVRMGVHRGHPFCQTDPLTSRMDYFGPMVNISARVCGLASGGEIIISEEASKGVTEADLEEAKLVLKKLGVRKLRGVSKEITIHRVLPLTLAVRGYRFDHKGRRQSDSGTTLLATSRIQRNRSFGAVEWLAKQSTALNLRLSYVEQARRQEQSDQARFRKITRVKAPLGRIALLFTDVEGATSLWDSHTADMCDAIHLHNQLFRGILGDYRCYEVKCEGDSFMLAFSSTADALSYAARMQERLMEAAWPEPLAALPLTKAVTGSDGSVLIKGLRVRMGIHVGEPICEESPVTSRMEYLGPMVNRTAYVSAYAFGGEIVITDDVFDELMGKSKHCSAWVIEGLGEHVFPGLDAPVKMYSAHPRSLRNRREMFAGKSRGESEELLLRAWRNRDESNPHASPFTRRTLSQHWKEITDIAEHGLLQVQETEQLLLGTNVVTDVPPPTGHIAIVFTDVQGSTQLWDHEPMAMRAALVLHNKTLREGMVEFRGYEVKTEGDAFMVAFSTPSEALKWCCAMQQALLAISWPPEILGLPTASKVVGDSGNLVWNGLRVRMGMHTGNPFCDPDPVTGRMDYFGPVVNMCARVAGLGRGGEIVASKVAVADMVSLTEELILTDLGVQKLRGIREPVSMVSIKPEALKDRDFGPLPEQGGGLHDWWEEVERQRIEQTGRSSPSLSSPRSIELVQVPSRAFSSREAISAGIASAIRSIYNGAMKASDRRRELMDKLGRTTETGKVEAIKAELGYLDKTVAAAREVAGALRLPLICDRKLDFTKSQLSPGTRTTWLSLLDLDHNKYVHTVDEVLALDEEGLNPEVRDKCRQQLVLSKLKMAAQHLGRKRVDPTEISPEEAEAMRSEFARLHKAMRYFFSLVRQFLGNVDPLGGSRDVITEDQFMYLWVKFQRNLEGDEQGKGRKSHIQEFAEQCGYALEGETTADWRGLSKSIGAMCNRYFGTLKQLVRRMNVQRKTLQQQVQNSARSRDSRSTSSSYQGDMRSPRRSEADSEEEPGTPRRSHSGRKQEWVKKRAGDTFRRKVLTQRADKEDTYSCSDQASQLSPRSPRSNLDNTSTLSPDLCSSSTEAPPPTTSLPPAAGDM
eukprot:Sspe_Gene.40844::Locus_19730_Transcript_1_1_Confidence_1.000_Length_5161::g.40844::m.40844